MEQIFSNLRSAIFSLLIMHDDLIMLYIMKKRYFLSSHRVCDAIHTESVRIKSCVSVNLGKYKTILLASSLHQGSVQVSRGDLCRGTLILQLSFGFQVIPGVLC